MKTLTRIAALAAGSALVLSACGQAPAEEGPSAAPSTSESAASVDYTACMVSDEGGFDDASFNERASEGLTKAENELGVKGVRAESQDAGAYQGNVDAMVQQNCDLILGIGFALEDTIQAAAEANTDLDFALLDSAFSAADFSPVELPNARPLLFNTHEAAFLAGYLAAGVTKTGTVATYGGQPFPSVTIFMDGFVDGVAKYNKEKGKDVKVLGWDKAKQNGQFTGNFSDVELGKTTTQAFIEQGADIILPVAGPVGAGSLQAASEADGVSVIWVDADGFLNPKNDKYKDLILTSVTKSMDLAIFETIKAGVDGAFSPEAYIGTLANDGVGLAPLHSFEGKVDAALVAEVDALKAQIIEGSLKVESPSSN